MCAPSGVGWDICQSIRSVMVVGLKVIFIDVYRLILTFLTWLMKLQYRYALPLHCLNVLSSGFSTSLWNVLPSNHNIWKSNSLGFEFNKNIPLYKTKRKTLKLSIFSILTTSYHNAWNNWSFFHSKMSFRWCLFFLIYTLCCIFFY